MNRGRTRTRRGQKDDRARRTKNDDLHARESEWFSHVVPDRAADHLHIAVGPNVRIHDSGPLHHDRNSKRRSRAERRRASEKERKKPTWAYMVRQRLVIFAQVHGGN